MASASTEREWEEGSFQTALAGAREGVIKARGVAIHSERLACLLNALPTEQGCRQVEEADFSGAVFHGDALFARLNLRGHACFDRAVFADTVTFARSVFTQKASFVETQFNNRAEFSGCAFRAEGDFSEATFDQARQFGPLLAGRLSFDRAVFVQPVRFEISARELSFDGAVFRAGADMFFRWAEVSFEDADLSTPCLVAEGTFVPHDGDMRLPREEPIADWWHTRFDESLPRGRPRVVSVRRAKVPRLNVWGVDMSACRFERAHGLGELRLDSVSFSYPPPGWRLSLRRQHWTRRRVIAEECHWRKEGANHGEDWYKDCLVRPPDWLNATSSPLGPEEIAGIYRALRTSHEDKNDAPGAGEFYYGEMEMRRQSARFSERSILWLYWLVSGYGLRATRAIVCLALTIVASAVLLNWFGFDPDRSLGRSILYALESTTSVLRSPAADLRPGGEVVHICLRLLGPLFLGLALLAVRGRVKR